MIELEALQKALLEGTGLFNFTNVCDKDLVFLPAYQNAPFSVTEGYDKMQTDLIKAKQSLTKVLTSKDVKATVCAALFTHEAMKFNSYVICVAQLNYP